MCLITLDYYVVYNRSGCIVTTRTLWRRILEAAAPTWSAEYPHWSNPGSPPPKHQRRTASSPPRVAAASCRSQERQHGSSLDVVVGVGKSSWLSRGVRVPLDQLLLRPEEVAGSSPGIQWLAAQTLLLASPLGATALAVSTICGPPSMLPLAISKISRSVGSEFGVRSRFC